MAAFSRTTTASSLQARQHQHPPACRKCQCTRVVFPPCCALPAPEQKPSSQAADRRLEVDSAPSPVQLQKSNPLVAAEDDMKQPSSKDAAAAMVPATRKQAVPRRQEQEEEQQQQELAQSRVSSTSSEPPAAAADAAEGLAARMPQTSAQNYQQQEQQKHNQQEQPEQKQQSNWLMPSPAASGAGAAAGIPAAAFRGPYICYELSKDFKQYKHRAQQLKAFFDQHNRLPSRSKSADTAEYKLARWLQVQRKEFYAGRLLPVKEQYLNDTMGSAEWQEPVKQSLSFYDMVERLKVWVAEEDGALPVISAIDDDNIKIGEWVHNRRTDYKQGKLTEEQIAALESIPGWQWVLRRTLSFEEGLEILKAYVEKHGKVPTISTVGDDERLKLGRWVEMQRGNKRKGKLSPERMQALEQVDGWFWEK